MCPILKYELAWTMHKNSYFTEKSLSFLIKFQSIICFWMFIPIQEILSSNNKKVHPTAIINPITMQKIIRIIQHGTCKLIILCVA